MPQLASLILLAENSAPLTGDTFPKFILIGVIILAVIGVVFTTLTKKKKK